MFENEHTALRHMDHEHIIKLNSTERKKCGLQILKFDFCKNGEMLNYVKLSKGLPEDVCRHYFSQMVDALTYIHSQNFCHLDLKLENILLDDSFKIKIIDFGFSRA